MNSLFSACFAVLFFAVRAVAADMTDFDGDGLPDVWEQAFGFRTNVATGIDGPYGDPDCDGLNNYAEFRAGYSVIDGNVYSNVSWAIAGLSPTNGHSVNAGVWDAYVRPAGTNSCLRYLYTDGDFCDDSWELKNPQYASLDLYDDARLLGGMTGWQRCRSAAAGSSAVALAKFKYNGSVGILDKTPVIVSFYADSYMLTIPTATATVLARWDWNQENTVVLTNWVSGSLTSGTKYVWAFADRNGDGQYQVGEPAGASSPYAVTVSGKYCEFYLAMTDTPSCAFRFSLAGLTSMGTRIRVLRYSVDGNLNYPAMLLDRVYNQYTRPYLCEADWLIDDYDMDWGMAGVPTSMSRLNIAYKVYAGDETILTNNALLYTFINTLEHTGRIPVTVSPANAQVLHKRTVQLTWTFSQPVFPAVAYTAFEVYLTLNGSLLYDGVIQDPGRDNAGTYSATLPFSLADGAYTWKIKAFNRKFVTATYSSVSSFSVAQGGYSPTNAGTCDVSLYYAGASSVRTFVAEAYSGNMFAGVPASSVAFTAGASVTNMVSGAQTRLTLLPQGHYYVLAWLDLDNDGVREDGEPWGYHNCFGENAVEPFSPKKITVPVSGTAPRVFITVEDMPGASRR